jgi:hypothetical protein
MYVWCEEDATYVAAQQMSKVYVRKSSHGWVVGTKARDGVTHVLSRWSDEEGARFEARRIVDCIARGGATVTPHEGDVKAIDLRDPKGNP